MDLDGISALCTGMAYHNSNIYLTFSYFILSCKYEKWGISVINYQDFDNDEQRYARDIWAFLYYCNGINFVDLLRMYCFSKNI